VRIFISYSIKRHFTAEHFTAELKERDEKLDCWYDSARIHGGDDWEAVIHEEISSCEIVLYILDRDSAKSRYCNHEISLAMGQQKRIIPILFEDCKKPPQVARLQHIDFRKTTREWERLINSIYHFLHTNRRLFCRFYIIVFHPPMI